MNSTIFIEPEQIVGQSLQLKQLQIKQNYLKEQILDNDDAERFVQKFTIFHQEKYPNQEVVDLNLISFEELKAFVKTYKLSKSKIKEGHHLQKNQQPTEILQPTKQMPSTIINSQIYEDILHKVFYDQKHKVWDYEMDSQEGCINMGRFFQNISQNQSLLVSLTAMNSKMIGGFLGIGAREELWVTVTTTFDKNSVQRKIQDFYFLREMIKTHFPYRYVPALYPDTIPDSSKLNEESKNNLKNSCRRFMHELVGIQDYLQNVYTWKFLTVKDYEKYLEHKGRNYNYSAVMEIKDLESIRGYVDLEITEPNEAWKNTMLRNGVSDTLHQKWKKITDITKKQSKLLADLKKLNATLLYQINDTCEKLTTHQNYYSEIIKSMYCFAGVVEVYTRNYQNFQKLYDNVSLKVGEPAIRKWTQFVKYEQELVKKSQQYKLKRSQFLSLHPFQPKEQIEEKKIKAENKLELNGMKHESLTKEQMTKQINWQGYRNKCYRESFEMILKADVDKLKQIMRNYAQDILQNRNNEEMSLISQLQSFNQ